MGNYDQGAFDQGTYSAQRQNARDRLAQALDKQSTAEGGVIKAQQARDQQAKDAANHDYGGSAVRGATLGMAFGPMGAGIGAGIGGLLGAGKDVSSRMAKGQGLGDALLGTITDLPGSLLGALGNSGAADLATGLHSQLQHKGADMPSLNDKIAMSNANVQANDAGHNYFATDHLNEMGNDSSLGSFGSLGDESAGHDVPSKLDDERFRNK